MKRAVAAAISIPARGDGREFGAGADDRVSSRASVYGSVA